jgi:diguanylate cyclase (GGDEF)-like protein/PAS domain S-box-containing protein
MDPDERFHQSVPDALLDKESRYRLIVDTAAEGYWRIDAQGRTVDVNGALCRMLGYGPEEMLGRSPVEFADAENQAILRYQIGRIRTTLHRAYELTLLRKDGSTIPLMFHTTTQHDARGEVEGAFAFVTDLSALKAAEAALRASDARWQFALEGSGQGVWDWDLDSDRVFYSSLWKAMLGYEEDAVGDLFAEWERLMHPEDRSHARAELQRHLRGETAAYRCEVRMRCGDGRFKWILSQGKVCESRPDGTPRRFIGTHSDITERKLAEEHLRQAAAVFENTAEGVIVTDHLGTIQAVNQAFSEITGYGEEDTIGNNPKLLKSGRHGAEFYVDMWQRLEKEGLWRGEIWNRRKSGEIYPEWLTISAVKDDEGRVTNYVGVFSDITHIKRSEAELNRLAYHDPLTGLPNRLLFLDRLAHALDRARRGDSRLALLFIDLDRFKNINDSLGHTTGDHLLVQVAERIGQRLRSADTLARLGGDEFILLMEELDDSREAALLARELLATLGQPIHTGEQEMFISASIGISIYPEDGKDADTLIKHADIAMYRTKEGGRNGYQFYTPDLSTMALQRFSLEASLHRALERHEFELQYQPTLEMASGKIVSLEALLRWRHPDLGMVPPDQFIPLAEETGLILPIGEWVLRTACGHLLDFLENGGDCRSVAVNMSVAEIERGDPVQRVGRILAETGLPPRCLELEITEGSAMRRGADSLAMLQALKNLGVTLTLDDFGRGYSNLGYLKRLPVDSVKIDREFVRDLPDDAEDAAITRAIIVLAHSLKLKVVAEGVETQRQMDYLAAHGCDMVQGYYCARPMPLAEVMALLAPASRSGAS